MRYSIYTLFEINTGLRFYVGCTAFPLKTRLRWHKASSKVKNYPVYQYIRANQIQFDIVEVSSCISDSKNPDLHYVLEDNWINFLRREGYILFNTNRKSLPKYL